MPRGIDFRVKFCSRSICEFFLLLFRHTSKSSSLTVLYVLWQAMARCHRIGQKSPVMVYRLLTTGSVEIDMMEKQVGHFEQIINL